MDRIGLVGAHWRRGLDTLERYAIPRDERAARLRALIEQAGVEEAMLLVTCNRVEVAFVGAEGVPLASYRPRIHEVLEGRAAEAGEAERSLRAWGGEGAVEHWFLVASGLDSARLAETEITGQFREARDVAQEVGALGARLGPLADAALRVAARIHQGAAPRGSLADVALGRLGEHLTESAATVALVGISPMTRRAAVTLAQEGRRVLWVNRSLARARDAAQELGGTALSLADFVATPPAVDGVVSATGAEGTVLHCAALERLAASSRSTAGPVLIDLAMPEDIDGEAARRIGLPLVTLRDVVEDASRARDAEAESLSDARVFVDDALDRFRRTLSNRTLAPVLTSLQESFRHTAMEGVERLFSRHLVGLDEDQQVAVRRWAETLARRLAHGPTEGLKRLAEHEGMDAVRRFAGPLDDLAARRDDVSSVRS